MEIVRDGFLISDEKDRLDLETVHRFLSVESYWAKGRTLEVLKKTIENSFCLGLYKDGVQIGFLRVITDFATFGMLCDVFLEESFRRNGVGTMFLQVLFDDPRFNRIGWCLKTKYSQSLYRKFGLAEIEAGSGWMSRARPPG